MSECYACSHGFQGGSKRRGREDKSIPNYWDIKPSSASSGSPNNVRSERKGSQVCFSWGCFSPGEVTLSLKVPSKESGERPFGISHSFSYSCMWRAWLPGNQVSGSLCGGIRLGNGAILKLSVAETYTEMSLGLENYFLNFHSKTTSFPIFLLEGRRDRQTLFRV